MVDHIKNRQKIVEALKQELVGPSPQGRPIQWSTLTRFETKEASYGPHYDEETSEEILFRDTPTVRYGVGVIYPRNLPVESEATQSNNGASPNSQDFQDDNSNEPPAISEEAAKSLQEIENRSSRGPKDDDSGDFEISTANSYKPSSMGISFLANFPPDSTLNIEASGGRYIKKKIPVAGIKYTSDLWLRKPVNISATYHASALCTPVNSKVPPTSLTSINLERIESQQAELKIQVEVFSRIHPESGPNARLLTVSLVNRGISGKDSIDELALFQAHFKLTITSPEGENCFLPYPGPEYTNLDDEEKSLVLLYLDKQTYAVGHGCAADWVIPTSPGQVAWLSAECLPSYETPSTTPDITQPDGTPLTVSMARLAGLIPNQDGFDDLSTVIKLYRNWIDEKRQEISALPQALQDIASQHLDQCERCANRMQDGLDYLNIDSKARLAFQLANYAMLLQQINTMRREPRTIQYLQKEVRWEFSDPYQAPDPVRFAGGISGKGTWRAFQIAFLLMSLKSSVVGSIPERATVELIWFPTGGGKTEAYLGLSAFTMFMRRLDDPTDAGVNVLMRYTLRLLTAQQFQRAAGLICAMEFLRRNNENQLGKVPFTAGIWLGGETTPNSSDGAIKALKALQNDNNAENPFVIARCPWCSAQMGKYDGFVPKGLSRVLGYVQQGDTVIFKCSDSKCPFFKSGLPIYVIDEVIYEKRPSLIIGTVDKFAMLAWRPLARALFGIDNNGIRFCTPPSLIIQDELHLIAGPLGSMVGLYETVIEDLCTDHRNPNRPIKPKLVCSTATIRRYTDQVKALYARDDVALFPPPGLNASDSFFSRYARDKNGKLLHGRLYVGVHAPGLGSMQTTEVRSFNALLQAPAAFTKEEQDPWWTLLVFFNSLRELGTTLTLFQSDIPDYINVFRRRTGLKDVRYPNSYKELTSRLRSDEIPEAIANLEVPTITTSDKKPIDTCLASNIIEVGVDIDRLSLMAVVGQPKTTAQYIQVTGRVGRRWQERPGLVVTLYGTSKPRDRSHFEKFRSYHERLYAQVEPTSVTPFSPPALDRALHAIMAIYTRQEGNNIIASSPYNFPVDMLNNLKKIILDRVDLVDKNEKQNTLAVFEKRIAQWQEWQPKLWDGDPYNSTNSDDHPLLRVAGEYADNEWRRYSWATPMSMRNVDAGCQAEITKLYLKGANSDE